MSDTNGGNASHAWLADVEQRLTRCEQRTLVTERDQAAESRKHTAVLETQRALADAMSAGLAEVSRRMDAVAEEMMLMRVALFPEPKKTKRKRKAKA